MARYNKRSRAAKKGWETRRRNERSRAAKKGWRTRRRNETIRQKKSQQKKEKRKQNILDRERFAFRLKDQEGAVIEKKLKGKKKVDVTIRTETRDGTVREREATIEVDEDDKDQFWRDYFEFAREELEDIEDEGDYTSAEVGVTVTSIR